MLKKQPTTIRGFVKAVVYTFPDGEAAKLLKEKDAYVKTGDKRHMKSFDKKYVKRRNPRRFLFLTLPGAMMQIGHHNIVTSEGDALIADLMQETPERTKFTNADGKIGVGDGYSAENKSVDALASQTGADESLDASYPVTKGNWAAADDNVIVYRSTFEAGDISNVSIDEAILNTSQDTMAYAQLTPSLGITSADTLQIDWELTILGA